MGAKLEACAFKEPGGRGAGQEADSRETQPAARSFLGKGRARPSFGPRLLSGGLVPLVEVREGKESRGSERTGSRELP